MVKVIDVSSKKEIEVDEKSLIFLEEKSDDYILSIPHSGLLILSEFKDKFNLGKEILIGCDLSTDKIYNTGKGIKIISRLNPYLINMNRFRNGGKKELPIHLQKSPFCRVGKVSLIGKEILKENFSLEEKERLILFYNKYHNLLKKSIKKMKEKYGYALIFDCHSLHSKGLIDTPDEGEERVDFVIGTLDDKSADLRLINKFYNSLRKEAEKFGLSVKKNYPYKGGAIPHIYSKPKENVHVIMLEVKKVNYMNEQNYKLNLEGVKKINSIVIKAIEDTSKEAIENLLKGKYIVNNNGPVV